MEKRRVVTAVIQKGPAKRLTQLTSMLGSAQLRLSFSSGSKTTLGITGGALYSIQSQVAPISYLVCAQVALTCSLFLLLVG